MAWQWKTQQLVALWKQYLLKDLHGITCSHIWCKCYWHFLISFINQFYPKYISVSSRLEEELLIPDSVHKICPIHFSFSKIGATKVLIIVYFVTQLITETLSLRLNSPIKHKCYIFVWNWGQDNVRMCEYVRTFVNVRTYFNFSSEHNTRVREKASAAQQNSFEGID